MTGLFKPTRPNPLILPLRACLADWSSDPSPFFSFFSLFGPNAAQGLGSAACLAAIVGFRTQTRLLLGRDDVVLWISIDRLSVFPLRGYYFKGLGHFLPGLEAYFQFIMQRWSPSMCLGVFSVHNSPDSVFSFLIVSLPVRPCWCFKWHLGLPVDIF